MMNGLRIFILSFVLGFVVAWDVSSLQNSNNHCGDLYFQPDYKGTPVSIKDGDQISDLTDVRYYLLKSEGDMVDNQLERHIPVAVTEQDQPPISFQVQSQCRLVLSNKTFLRGEVLEFMENENNVAPERMSPKSVGCECLKKCECEDIRLRRSECARAYLKDDCTNCNAMFTSFTPASGVRKDFPQKWSSEVKSIILKRQCKVLLETVNKDGDVSWKDFSKSGLIKNVQTLGNITRYECSCVSRSNSEPKTKPKQQHNENYPPLISIPRAKQAIKSLLFKEELRNHSGLIASLQSLRNKKSSKNAYILILGLTGTGKSTAINLLFDHPNITKVGDYVSTTSDIFEYTIPTSVDELGIQNGALHIIDTPGIADTRGVEADSRYLASLEKFLSKHEDLRHRLPNVVLIFSKFSENRYNGDGSGFVKMLRTMDLFKDRIIDKKSTNVIFVFTHYMSETKAVTRDPTERIESIRKVIKEFSTLPRPIHIVLAENKPEEFHLPSKNGFFALPNGEYYPKNLFDQMQRNLIDNGDPIGEAIIRTVFANPDNFKISGKLHPLLPSSHEDVTKYLGILGSFNKPISNTEVSVELNKYYNESLDSTLKQEYPSVLNTLQRTLYLRNIYQISDLPQTSKDVLKLLEAIPINPASLALLSTAFNITVPKFDKDFVTGSGYSLVSDSILPASIFEVGCSCNVTDLLFMMPNSYVVTPQNELDKHFQFFTDRSSYVEGRMEALGLPSNALPQDAYLASPLLDHPGFNLVSLSDNETTSEWNSLTATIDYHTFHISLSENVQLGETFVNDLYKLQSLNLSDADNVQGWDRFFKRYGTHVVAHAFGGGQITVKAEVVESDEMHAMNNTEKFSVLSKTMGSIVTGLADELISKDASFEPPPGVQYKFLQRGGSHVHFWSNFSELDEIKNVDLWRESLKYEPVILTNRLKLVPISELVKQHVGVSNNSSMDLGYLIEEAAATLINASLVYIPSQPLGYNKDDNPNSRDRTVSGHSFGSKSGDFESMKEFASMFQTLTESSKAMQDKLMQMMEKSRENQEKQEQELRQQRIDFQNAKEEETRKIREAETLQADKDRRLEELRLQKFAEETALHAKNEEVRINAQMQYLTMMAESSKSSQKQMLDFINAENERQNKFMIARMSRPDNTLGIVKTAVGGVLSIIGMFG